MTKAPTGPAALETYADVLAMLASGRPTRRDLPFLRNVRGVGALFRTIAAVNAVRPGALDEEWNPLSQRPHGPLPPPPKDALGYEVRTLKTAIDAFTTLAHEMMHIALWEPFFAGRWRPRSRGAFVEFSLMGEGYCYFFSDVVVSGAVRERLPDGEYAMERRTHENAFFHPVRAFDALGISGRDEILDVYLEAFRGRRTRLWQPRGTHAYAAALAEQIYDFYESTLLPLSDLHVALESFKGISEYFKRYCAVPGLPTFLDDKTARSLQAKDVAAYFASFHRTGMAKLASLADGQIERIRQRRALQMRGYYALQVRWLLSEGLVAARALTAPKRRELVGKVVEYGEALEGLLRELGRRSDPLPAASLAELDGAYERQVRGPLLAHEAWVAKRWLLIPRRAGGLIHVGSPETLAGRDAKVRLLQLATYLVDALTRRLRESGTVEERAELMAAIRRVAALGAAAHARDALRRMDKELMSPRVREVWSVPLAGFDPAANRFRELVLSYQ